MGEPKFRAKQIFIWMYDHFIDSFEEMLNLPKEFRKNLDENFALKYT